MFSISDGNVVIGYIAYTGESVTLNINGTEYKFGAQLVESAALIDWGFGMKEYWQVGATATHEDTIIDGIFGYTFDSLLVGEGENKATATLVAIHPKALAMSLTLHSQIGLNLMLNQKAFAGAVIKLNNETYTLADLTAVDGIYKITAAIAPNVANEAITLVIEFNSKTHTIPISIATYAETILKSEDANHVAAHNLTYAMVEYVRAMTGVAEFCNVTVPEGIAQAVDTEKVYNKGDNVLLSNIAFQLDKTIAIAITGTADAEGKKVHLVLATGRGEWGTIKNGVAIFEGLYINEFFGDMTIEVYDVSGEGEDAVKTDLNETYTYSIENYYNAMGDSHKPAIAALYSYAYYAQAYVDALPKNA